MGDLDPHAGLAADPDRFAHGVEQSRGLVAHVSRVDSAGRGHVAGQFDHLFGGAMPARLINQPGGEADRAGLEPFAHQLAHRALLVRVGARRAIPITAARMVLCPTSIATLRLGGACSTTSR